MPKPIPEPLDLPIATETLQNAPFGILVIDTNEQVVWMNKTFETFLNMDAGNVIGKGAMSISHPVFKAILRLNDEIVVEASGRHGHHWLRCWRQPLEIDNTVAGNTYFLIDVSDHYKVQLELERIQKILEEKSTRDPLTGLLNRRGLMEVLETQVSRSRRYNNPLSLVRMQIAGVKTSADTVPTRNQILMSIGYLFNDQLRWADISGRLQDEDFLLILPETDNDAALKLVDKIRSGLENLVAGKNEQKVSVSVCLGITSWAKGDDQGKLLERAERAMAAAKNFKEPMVTS